ncbi:hypothetical protein [Psychrobacillus vulpis]|uniref:Lipoprotein n=1 Tax=Psychrobacillus vulpis TaxID=2325572 RepID=A0A544TT90_9BACI|nr:hypothetical protein [Psychrobacillus vulpis]TQR20655.1 hypothetical protein FG384_06045 [Psychrobacillus vulpis]
MRKIFVVMIVFTIFSLSACGSTRESNAPANPETQIDSQSDDIPNTGNEEVNEENDMGIPRTGGTIEDPTFQKP